MGCVSTDTRTLVRFIDNELTVTKGEDTLFCSSKLSLSNYFLSASSYNFESVVISATGGTANFNRDMNFIYASVEWPTSALESEKTIELQLSNFDYVGGTGPLGATAVSSERIPIKNLFVTDSVEKHGYLYFTNNSIHNVTLNLFTAKV